MTTSATATEDLRDELDELVPPPGPRWRRAMGWLGFLAILGAVGWAWTSGTATPQLDGVGWSYGGEGPVQTSVVIVNRSRVAVEIVAGPRSPDGLALLGYQVRPPSGDSESPTAPLDADPFPMRIEPGEERFLGAWYEVTDCDAVAADVATDDRIDLQARIADGPFGLVTRTVWIEVPSIAIDSPTGSNPTSWTVAMTQYACP